MAKPSWAWLTLAAYSLLQVRAGGVARVSLDRLVGRFVEMTIRLMTMYEGIGLGP